MLFSQKNKKQALVSVDENKYNIRYYEDRRQESR